MGCFLSILRPRPPPGPSNPTESEQHPKPSDSDSRSCKSISSPEYSTDLKSPFITIVPATPCKSPFVAEVESIKIKKEPLDLPIEEVNREIAALIALIEDCQVLSKDNTQRIFEDINAILDIISENILIYTKLEILRSQLNTLYRENESAFGGYLHSAIDRIPALWMEFAEFSEEQKRQEAKMQGASSPIMQIFDHLARFRSACDAQRDLDLKIERKVGGLFEDILGDLRDVGTPEAALKWRVFGMLVGQRRREGEEMLDGLLGLRIRVSGLLVEVVEALSEED